MNLLKELSSDFRYALYHTSDSRIIILFLKSNEIINDSSITQIESLYENTIFKNYKINSSETVKVTCNENESSNNIMNSTIAEYCRKYNDSVEVRMINVTPSHKILFEPKVIKAIFDTSKELYLDIGDSGVRIDSSDFKTMDKIYIQTGTLYPESTATIYVRDLFVMNTIVNVANNEEDKHVLNVVVSKKANIINMKLYSTINTVFTAGSQDGENIANTIFLSNYISIYGSENIEDTKERLGLYSFKTVLLGELNIEDEVTSGNILRVDKLVSFTLNRLSRNMKTVNSGNCIVIDRVGNVNLNYITSNIFKDSAIADNYSLILMTKDDSGMHKKLTINNSYINNPLSTNINLISIEDNTIENVFISDCVIGNGITFINKSENAKITKLTYNNTTINVDDKIKFNNIENLYFLSCDINCNSDIYIESSYVTINGGIWNFTNCYIGKTSYITLKINTNEVEMHGKKLSILNDTVNSFDGKYFDNNSKFNVETLYIKGFQTALAGTVLFTKLVETYSDAVLTINRSTFILDEKMDLKVNSSLTGTIMISTENTKDKFNIELKDVQKFLQNNIIDFVSLKETPLINVSTNNTIKLKMINHSNEFLYINYYKDFDSDQKSKVVFVPMIEKSIDYKIITDTEKLIDIAEVENEDDNQNIVYEITKK